MKRRSLVDEDQSEAPFRQDLERQECPRTRSAGSGSRESSEGLSAYLKAISKFPLLTKDQEQELARRVRKGDAVAKERMVLANLRLVLAIARKYRGMGLPLADLIGEGNLGLIKAVERFEYEKGFRFSTYASKWIRQAITKTLASDSRTVRLPANVIEMVRKVRATEENMLKSDQTEPAEADVCSRLGLTAARYAQMANASSSVSLDAPCTPDGEVSLHEMLADQSAEMPDTIAFQHIDSDKLENYLQNLSRRERRILSYRFGLEDGNLRSLAETGKMVGITRERIRQIEKRAIDKIRRMMKKRRMQRVLMQRQ